MKGCPVPELGAAYLTSLHLNFLDKSGSVREDLRNQSISNAKKCAQRADALFPGCLSIVPLPTQA